MNKMLIATATALSMAAIPAAVQAQQREAPENVGSFYSASHEQNLRDMDPDFRIRFEQLDAEKQTMYFGWDAALREYYQSLDNDRQDAWWYLSEEQRINMFQIENATKRAESWNAIVAKLAAEDYTDRAMAAAGTYGSDKGTVFLSRPVVQQVAYADGQVAGEYPVCTSDYDDHCINAWAAGMRGPDVNRPLDYWPGESVSDTQFGG